MGPRAQSVWPIAPHPLTYSPLAWSTPIFIPTTQLYSFMAASCMAAMVFNMHVRPSSWCTGISPQNSLAVDVKEHNSKAGMLRKISSFLSFAQTHIESPHCEALGWKSCSEGKLRAAAHCLPQLKNHLLFIQTSTCCWRRETGRKGSIKMPQRPKMKIWNWMLKTQLWTIMQSTYNWFPWTKKKLLLLRLWA